MNVRSSTALNEWKEHYENDDVVEQTNYWIECGTDVYLC